MAASYFEISNPSNPFLPPSAGARNSLQCCSYLANSSSMHYIFWAAFGAEFCCYWMHPTITSILSRFQFSLEVLNYFVRPFKTEFHQFQISPNTAAAAYFCFAITQSFSRNLSSSLPFPITFFLSPLPWNNQVTMHNTSIFSQLLSYIISCPSHPEYFITPTDRFPKCFCPTCQCSSLDPCLSLRLYPSAKSIDLFYHHRP